MAVMLALNFQDTFSRKVGTAANFGCTRLMALQIKNSPECFWRERVFKKSLKIVPETSARSVLLEVRIMKQESSLSKEIMGIRALGYCIFQKGLCI